MNPSITRRQHVEVGVLLAIALIALYHFRGHDLYLYAALAALLLVLIVPVIFTPLSWLWFGISKVLAQVVPLLLLTILFYLLVTPIGLFRRLLGKDSQRLNEFKRNDKSVLVPAREGFSKKDFERAF